MPAVRLLRITGGTINPEPDPPERPVHTMPMRPPRRLRGEPPPTLTARQAEILTHFAHGDVYEEVSEQLGLSFFTICGHARAILTRLNARNSTHAVAIALTNGWITLTPPEP